MTPEQRAELAAARIWYWLPARWTDGSSWYEIRGYAVTDRVTVQVTKDDAPGEVEFSDADLEGDDQLSPEAARARVEAV